MPMTREDLGRRAVQRPHLRDRGLARSASDVRPDRRPLTRKPVPSRLVRSRTSPGRAPPLRNSRSGWRRADHREAVLGLRVADRVAAREHAARLADLRGRGLEHRRHRVAREVLGERRDRQREQDPAAHREHVGERVRGGDLAEVGGIVDERRKEVERAEDREVVGDPVGGGVVGRLEAGDEGGVGRPAARPRPSPRQRLGQQVRAELGRAAAAVGQLGEADRRAELGGRTVMSRS